MKCSMKHCETPVFKSNNGRWRLVCDDCESHYGKTVSNLGGNGSNSLFTHAVKGMVSRARSRGKFEVEITTRDILNIWPTDNKCPIMGTVFETVDHKEGTCRNTSPSLDRIDPDKGYVVGNIQVICNLANSMKQNASNKQLEKFCVKMLEMLEENRL